MECRWAVCLANRALFTTDDCEVVQRFAAMGSFDVFDHHSGCYQGILHSPHDAVDLLTDEDFIDAPFTRRTAGT